MGTGLDAEAVSIWYTVGTYYRLTARFPLSITHWIDTLCPGQSAILGAHWSRAIGLKLTSVEAAIASGENQVGVRASDRWEVWLGIALTATQGLRHKGEVVSSAT